MRGKDVFVYDKVVYKNKQDFDLLRELDEMLGEFYELVDEDNYTKKTRCNLL